MTRWGKRFTTIVLVTAGTTGIMSLNGTEGARAQGPDAAKLEVGQMFPTTVFPSLDGGHPRSVADFRGKKLILHIWASW
jgi:hypothetical protein